MKRLLITFVILIVANSINLFATNNTNNEKYHQVKVYFNDNFKFDDVLKLGFDTESMSLDKDFIELIMTDKDIQKLRNNNISFDIEIEDLENYFEKRLNDNCLNYNNKNDMTLKSENFKYGSMGAYYKLDEIYTVFQNMREKYPNISILYDSIGYTYQNRKIACYTFGEPTDNIKPATLITALHHAREPGTIMTLVYFLWDLLDKVAVQDEEANYLLTHRTLYVIPVVNPDGYFHNETRKPSGGGLWRKNRIPIGDTAYGVDLNRNYGPYEFWDASNYGSSTNPDDDTYRGFGPFSELETQTMRDFCLNHLDIKNAINLHTYGNLLLYPYSAYDYETNDSSYYRNSGVYFTKDNKFSIGRDIEAVGYQTRGASDDWFYYQNEEDGKTNKIFSYTAELGTSEDGFWPQPYRILPIAQQNLSICYQILWSSGVNIRPIDVSPNKFEYGKNPIITIKNLNIGVEDAAETCLCTLKSLDNRFEVISEPKVIEPLPSNSFQIDTFEVKLNSENFINGELIPFEVVILQEGVSRRDTFKIRMIGFVEDTLFIKGEADLWTMNDWGLEFDDYSNSFVLSDSPQALYQDSTENYLILTNQIEINEPTILEFITKWQIERNGDFAVIDITTDGGENWLPFKSSRMIKGIWKKNGKQDSSRYGFTGNFPMWYKQELDLSDYINKNVKIRFGLLADANGHYNGWQIQEIKLKKYTDLAILDVEDYINTQDDISVFPIPLQSGNDLNIALSNNILTEQIKSITISDLMGRQIANYYYDSNVNMTKLKTNSLSSGIYKIEIRTAKKIYIKKIIVL